MLISNQALVKIPISRTVKDYHKKAWKVTRILGDTPESFLECTLVRTRDHQPIKTRSKFGDGVTYIMVRHKDCLVL